MSAKDVIVTSYGAKFENPTLKHRLLCCALKPTVS